ncbi:hypothetical protein [Natronolimnobius baerhuensis]|uniref:Uncharacterized protein n=1 Tax=Natronolimnobius baerhuensis TaxID=253108 RepID=A0A202E6H5_9EURY|nr:hypothetical protein [Natronolimnobius baerhuensis]OVE83876.1 hypothetical protein B2G88_15815 [Natronolimnobius baerhuensis]
MDKQRLPRWGWLLLGLFAMSVLSTAINMALLDPRGLEEAYQIVTVITMMAPVLIYVGVWYDEHRQHYWEHPTERIIGDLTFVLFGALIGSTMTLAVILGLGLPRVIQDIIAMGGGFMLSWGLFWWRNPDLYFEEATS